ncbi:MAG: hypothetical protein JSU08_16735 [Acidobacteria bacterium]|nr:hypothetical protein [Acidobacteriota bacterium]
MDLVTGTLILLGAGFLVANVRLLLDYMKFKRRARHALLTWPSPPLPFQSLTTALGFATGALVLVKVFLVHRQVFGETMMFVYFAGLLPLSRRIGRGFYDDGIWADTAFIPYTEVGGVTWRESEHAVSLIVISRLRNLARRLAVPLEHYGEARRLLREKIGHHEIQFGTGLDLGGHDERENA